MLLKGLVRDQTASAGPQYSMGLCCGLLQWWIDGAADNLLATLLIVLSTVVLYEYLIPSRAILDQPISTFDDAGLQHHDHTGGLVRSDL